MGAYTYKTSDLLVTSIEKNEIKQNSPETLPLNPTGQGFSGQEVRRRLSHSIVGEEGSLLSLFTMRMEIVKELLDDIKITIEDIEINKEDKSNKAVDFSVIDDEKYPSVKASEDRIDSKVNTHNIDAYSHNDIRTDILKKLDKSGGTMTGDLDMNGNDISYVKELQVEKVTTGGGYSIEIEDDIDMRDNIIENVDIVKFAYGLQIQRSADKKEIRFYVPKTGGYGLIFKIVDGELRLHDGVKITNLADGTHIKDAVTKGQLDLKADQLTTYTKTEVNNLISQIPKFKIIKVSVLPTENIDLMAIYILGNAEYIYIEDKTRWEKLGTLEVNMNDYYDKTEIANLLLGKVNTTRTINGKELKNDIVLNAIDIYIENGSFVGKNVEEALDTLSVITQNIPRIEKPVLENEIEVVLEPMGTVNTQLDMTKESIENGTLWIDDVKVVEKGVALDGYISTEIQGGYKLTGGGYDIAFYYESGEYGGKGDIVDLNAKGGTLKFLVNIKTYVDYEIDKVKNDIANIEVENILRNEYDDKKYIFELYIDVDGDLAYNIEEKE